MRTAAGKSLLVWDNAPPHHTRLARETAEATGIMILPLPFRSPELMPCEDSGGRLKRVVAANRAYADVDELARRGMDWLDDRTPDEILRIAGCYRPSSTGYLLSAMPRKPIWVPARTALPTPAKTSTNVPTSSAAYFCTTGSFCDPSRRGEQPHTAHHAPAPMPDANGSGNHPPTSEMREALLSSHAACQMTSHDDARFSSFTW